VNRNNIALIASLLFGINIAIFQAAEASDRELFQLQAYESKEEQRCSLLLKEFNELFLDDWQKLVLEGRNAEAVNVARQTEQDSCTSVNKEAHKRNTALSYGEYRQSQHRTYLEPNDRFSPTYFRVYQAAPEKLIKKYQDRILALTNEFKSTEASINSLQHKKETSPKHKGVLRQKIQTSFDRMNVILNDISASTEDQAFLTVVSAISFYVREIYQVIEAIKPDQYGDAATRDEKNKIVETKLTISNLLNHSVWTEKKEAAHEIFREYQRQCQNGLTRDREKARKLHLSYQNMCDFLPQAHDLAYTAQEYLLADPNDTLSASDAKLLENYLMNWEAFCNDTADKIERENKRISFINANPDFFQIRSRSRAELLGITDPEQWSVSKPSHPLGHGVIVGVIDSFDSCLQSSKILHKAVNPNFISSGCVRQFDGNEQNSHGIHVAGIIVSDEISGDLTVGVAPGAQFEMIDCHSLASKFRQTKEYIAVQRPDDIQWSVSKMSEAISELTHTGAIAEIRLSANMIGDNPISQSRARILNFSMGHSSLKRFTRIHLNEFEGIDDLPFLLEISRTRLLIQALGNDGVNVCTTSQKRLLKAFALCRDTSKHCLFVTNLMQDGTTLNPSSNIAGEEAYLQSRTLSAPGTEINSTVLMTDTQSASYEEMTGTSMATPHVSGVAAVVLSRYPMLTIEQLGRCLLDSATPLIIKDSGMTIELSNVMACYLSLAFENSPYAATITIQGHTVNRVDWMRGKACYGQGRVHLGNALKLANMMNPDLT
jgi:hypothetical protein